jgi:hypothetical protein
MSAMPLHTLYERFPKGYIGMQGNLENEDKKIVLSTLGEYFNKCGEHED